MFGNFFLVARARYRRIILLGMMVTFDVGSILFTQFRVVSKGRLSLET